MLITGCSNSLLTKFQDKQCISNCDAPVNQRKHFDQPVIQTIQMFVAEMCVGFVILYNHLSKILKTKFSKNGYHEIQVSAGTDNTTPNEGTAEVVRPKLDGKRILLLSIPASCDLLATTMMNIGLLLIPVSVFQMVRGAIVLFVGFFSVVFLGRTLFKKQWIGLVSVFGGVFIVGLSAMFYSSSDSKKTALEDTQTKTPTDSGAALQATIGVLLILVAQLFSATQFVVEEFILEKYSMEPLNVVMWEGVFGTSITLFGSLVISAIFLNKHSTTGSMFNLGEGFGQLFGNKAVLISSVVIMFMMSTFNVTGMTVTRLISATSRSTIDTSRTVGIWLVSLLIGWEKFQFLQLAGFLLLVYGTLLFNGIIGNDEEIKENVEEMLPNEFEHT